MTKIMIFRKGCEYSMMKIQHFDNIHPHHTAFQPQTSMHQGGITVFPNNTFTKLYTLSPHNLDKTSLKVV